MSLKTASISWIFLAILSHLVWLGFVLHTSAGEVQLLGKYSPGYAGLLAFLTFLWLFILWLAWQLREKLGLLLRIAGLNILITFLLLIATLPSVYIYMHQKSLKNSLLNPPGPDTHSFFQIDMAPQLLEPEHSDTIRILTLGGSTTYGSRLERNQTYPCCTGKASE